MKIPARETKPGRVRENADESEGERRRARGRARACSVWVQVDDVEQKSAGGLERERSSPRMVCEGKRGREQAEVEAPGQACRWVFKRKRERVHGLTNERGQERARWVRKSEGGSEQSKGKREGEGEVEGEGEGEGEEGREGGRVRPRKGEGEEW